MRPNSFTPVTTARWDAAFRPLTDAMRATGNQPALDVMYDTAQALPELLVASQALRAAVAAGDAKAIKKASARLGDALAGFGESAK